ncbi:DUF6245 family protein [Kitasatospora sp. NPDC001225]
MAGAAAREQDGGGHGEVTDGRLAVGRRGAAHRAGGSLPAPDGCETCHFACNSPATVSPATGRRSAVAGGPLPVAAVQAAEGLHVMPGALGGTYAASAAGDVEGIAFQLEMQRAARGLLQAAVDNIDSVLDAVDAANNP